MRNYALAHAALIRNDGGITLHYLNKLPDSLRLSATSLSMFAKTYAEMLDYRKASMAKCLIQSK